MTRRQLIAALQLAIGETADEQACVMVRYPAGDDCPGGVETIVESVEWEAGAPVLVLRRD